MEAEHSQNTILSLPCPNSTLHSDEGGSSVRLHRYQTQTLGPGMLRMSLVICPPCSKLSSRLQERGNLCGSRNLQLSGGMAGRCLPHWWVQTGPSTDINELFSISSSSPPVQPLFSLFIHSWDPHTSLPDWGVILMCLFRDVWVRDFQMWPKRDTETRLDSVASFWICDVRIYTSCKLSSTFSGFYKWFTPLFIFPLVCSRVHEALPERREVYLSWKVPLSPSVFWPSLRGEEEVTLVGLGQGVKGQRGPIRDSTVTRTVKVF